MTHLADAAHALRIRKATPDDLPRLMDIFQRARLIMRASGNLHQWTGGYPTPDVVAADIAQGHCHLCTNAEGKAMGTFAFIPGKDPTYATIYQGKWKDDTLPYGTIHRLAALPGGHGVATACIDWCYAALPNLRADTHRDNRIMQHILTKHGFQYCGIIHLANGDERLAYQKCGRQQPDAPSASTE